MNKPISPLAEELNQTIVKSNKTTLNLLSSYGKRLFFPKGIVSQSAEAAQKAKVFDATIGIAKEQGRAMMLPSLENFLNLKTPAHKVLPYAPSAGLPELRRLWQERQKKSNPSLKKSSLPIVTSGLTHGLSLAGELFLDRGDSVVLADMFWGNYKLIWQIKGEAQFYSFPFFDQKLEKFNLEGFEETLEKVPSEKIFLALNFPHNPTGYSLTQEESKALCQSLKNFAERGKKIVALCDDAYFGLTFEKGLKRESLFADLCELHENILAVKIDGCTKEFFMWGMRIGFITFGSKGLSEEAYKALEQKAAAALRGNISNVNHHSQELVKELFESPSIEEEAKAKEAILEERYKETKKHVYKNAYKEFWDVYPFNSGYFMCIRLKNNMNSEKFRLHLLEKYETGVISLGSCDVRIAFSCIEKESIGALFEILAKACQSLS